MQSVWPPSGLVTGGYLCSEASLETHIPCPGAPAGAGGDSVLTTSRMLSAALERESFCFCCMAIPDICWFTRTRSTLQTSSTNSSWNSGTNGGTYSFGVFGRPLIGGSFIGSRRYKLKRWPR